MVFALYLYYMIGRQLEYAWGAFRFNLYFLTGVLFHILAAILVYVITGISFPLGTFMVIPIKVKYLACLDAAYF